MPSCFQHHLLKRLFFLHWIIFVTLSKISWAYLCLSTSLFPMQPIMYTFFPSPMLHSLDYCVHWNQSDWVLPLFFFIIVLAIWVSFLLHINFRIILSIAAKEFPWILIRIVLNLFWENCHLYYVEFSNSWI